MAIYRYNIYVKKRLKYMVVTYVHTYVSGPLLYYTPQYYTSFSCLILRLSQLASSQFALPKSPFADAEASSDDVVGWCVKRERERGRRWQLECSGNVGLLGGGGGGGASFFCQRWWMSRGNRCTVMPKQERTEERERERCGCVCEREREMENWVVE